MTRSRRTLIAVYILSASLALIEAVLRGMGLANPILYEPDAKTGYRLKPDQHVTALGNKLTINNVGLRDPRPVSRAENGVHRVLVLGDSVTWGGVTIPQESLFTTRLERAIASTEFLNGGVNGYSVGQMTALYTARYAAIHPDLLLVCVIPPDFSRPANVSLTRNSAAFPLERPWTACGMAVEYARIQMASRFSLNALRPKSPVSPAPGSAETPTDRLEENIDALTAIATQAKPRVAVVVLPQMPGTAGSEHRVEVLARLGGLGMTVIDLAPRKSWSATHFLDGTHLSESGHAAVAETLAPLLTPLLASLSLE